MKVNRTIERAIEVLSLLSKEKKGLNIKELLEIMQIPKTSLYDILETLVFLEMIEKDFNEQNRYKIGIKSFQIGNSYSGNRELFSLIKKPMQELAERTNNTVFFAVENNHEIVYMSKFEPEKAIITTSNVGSTNPMYCTSLGKAILSFSPEPKMKQMIDSQSYVKKTSFTLSKDELLKEVETIKQRGYAIDNREVEEHMLCIGAPIFNHNKEVVGAISISNLYSENRNIEEEAAELLKTTQEISRKLGC